MNHDDPVLYGVLATVEKCPGEAHKNPYIDNCAVCSPNWGYVVCCASCGRQMRYTDKGALVRECPLCNTYHAAENYGRVFRQQQAEALANVTGAKLAEKAGECEALRAELADAKDDLAIAREELTTNLTIANSKLAAANSDLANARIDLSMAREELNEMAFRSARTQLELNTSRDRAASAEAGFKVLLAEYNALLTKLSRYEKVTS